MRFIRVQSKCHFDETACGCYANEAYQDIPCITSHCCSHLRLESSLFAWNIQYHVQFTKCNTASPVGDHLSVLNVSRVIAVPFRVLDHRWLKRFRMMLIFLRSVHPGNIDARISGLYDWFNSGRRWSGFNDVPQRHLAAATRLKFLYTRALHSGHFEAKTCQLGQ